MSEPEQPDLPDPPEEDREDEAVRALLQRVSRVEPKPAPLLPGVQRRIRKRSRGKFFADGWSVTQSRVNYGLVAIVMLVLVAITYLALGPLGISPP